MQPCYHGYMEQQAVTIRFPKDLHEWLRRESFDTRDSINAVVIAAVEERRARSALRGKVVHHKDGDPNNLELSDLELRERPS